MFQHSRISPAALVGVAFAHAALLGLLLLAPDTTEPITPPRPLMVSLIEPEVEEPQPQPKRQPKLQPPKPVVKPLPPPPILAAKSTLAPISQPEVEAPKSTP
ncbi:MAG: energy transducer TonB, partial [Hydrogenophilales bacterium 16-61-112]